MFNAALEDPLHSLPMAALPRGLYETLITEALASQLTQLKDGLLAKDDSLRAADAADRIALHVGRTIERAVASVPDKERVKEGIELARRIIQEVDRTLAKADLAAEMPVSGGRVLHAITSRLPDGSELHMQQPIIPLLDTALLTNAPGEPRVGRQLLDEIHSADGIDILMAFIRLSGIRPLLDALRAHRQDNKPLRVLTTTYTGSTEAKALDMLRDLGADIRVSYDTGSTRLHAKAWLFHRNSDFATAYIGSSNLTHSAQVSGLEWNVRASAARNRPVVDKVSAVFETYWNSADFVPYDAAQFLEEQRAASSSSTPRSLLSPVEVRLEPFQEHLLEQIAVSRRTGHHRNLLVSATGTGKTVMAAVDYARLRSTLPRARLLFVAHRKEILTQSLLTFRQCLRDQAFGELWVDGERPAEFQHVFASVQTLASNGTQWLDSEHFDVVIVDEFHHAAAPSYAKLLAHLQPVELLGLTATPERSDGMPLLSWFGDRIAAELRLWDAIDQHRLTPFLYFGIHDGLDLRDVPWKRGRGYDVDELTSLYTATDAWATHVLKQVELHVDNPHKMRALGFCVSVEHARYMARAFTNAGLPSVAVWADTAADERRRALTDLASGTVNVVFSVDLFNEGVDVPLVDTLLMLRPTDSPTLFLQQLGRGLRRTTGKTACTVLDFVGQHRKEFRIDRRLRALLGGTLRTLTDQIERGFPFLPAGCHMQLDAVAREIVLTNIRNATPSKWTAKVEELRRLVATGAAPTIDTYLRESGVEIEDIYAGNKSWTDLCEAAGVKSAPHGPREDVLRRSIGRLLHVDDLTRLNAYQTLLGEQAPPRAASLSERDRRLLRMLVASVVDQAVDKTATLEQASELLWQHAAVRNELSELFAMLAQRVEHLHADLTSHPDVPLQVHARYSRIEILSAFGLGGSAKVAPWQTGVYHAERAQTDLLAFTLDKTAGDFSPTTRYRDYAVSSHLIHWESQSVVRAQSDTGLRYQNHALLGAHVLLFARLRSDDRAFWFLGPASYVKHEGELPMAVTWRLKHALPGDLFARFAAAVA